MSRPTKAELRIAREIGALLPALRQCDLVRAVLPDSTEIIVKGRDLLSQIVASGRQKRCTAISIPVPTREIAAGLELALGDDGAFTAPDHVGHA